MKHYVVGFLFNPDRTHVVLIKKARPEWQAGKYNGVGGLIEPGESPKRAMCREFQEETGAGTLEQFWDHFLTLTYPDATIFFFRGFDPNYQMVETKTDEEVAIVDLASLHMPQLKVIDNLRWIIPLALSPDCGEMTLGEVHTADGLMPVAREFSIGQQELVERMKHPLGKLPFPTRVMDLPVEGGVFPHGASDCIREPRPSNLPASVSRRLAREFRRALKFLAGPKIKP